MDELVLVKKQDLANVVSEAVKAALESFEMKPSSSEQEVSTLIYGINGLAKFLGVSMPTAQKYKVSHRLTAYSESK